ncbi:MAG: GNAT family N-acetyltransferase [Frankiaceae bacterium]|nr:GNAT family N-acetyltransferase [Frankiaceae bacterium]
MASDPVGTEYLAAVTSLLQSWRTAHPTGGLWEAADLQWWWPRDPHDEPGRARVWYDDGGPAVAAVLTVWGKSRAALDVLGDRTRPEPWEWLAQAAPPVAAEHGGLESAVPDGEPVWEQSLAALGFSPTEETYLSMWQPAADVAAPPDPPDGYRVTTRAERSGGMHWLASRNSDEVEARLRQCSLYDPRCDIAVVHEATDEVVAYSLYWPDAVTGVGLVEPVRVEDDHSGRGIGGVMIRHGIAALRDAGCSRLKVSSLEANTPAVRLYQGAGFRVAQRERTWRLST